VYPTAIGWHPSEKAQYGASQLSAWQTMQRAHAISNGVFVVAVNRVGHEGAAPGGLEFWGHSFVADPFGVVLAEAGRDKEELLVVEIDPAHAETVRQHWPFLRDRRVDAYGPILERYIGS
jgi:N-carbamoylputrescine amidase